METTDNSNIFEEKAFQEDIFESIPIGVIIIDRKGKILKLNAYQEKISRVKRDGIIGRYFHEVWKRLFDQNLYGDKYKRLLEENESYTFVFHKTLPQFYDMRISGITHGAPLLSGKGFVLLHAISEEVGRDKLTLELLARQLSESLEFLRNLIDSSPNIVFTLDKDGFITTSNKTAERLLGYTKGEFLWLHITRLLKDAKELDDYSAMETPGRGIEVVCEGRGGTVFPARMQLNDIKNDTGETTSKLVILADISYEKNMEISLEERLSFEKLLFELSSTFVNLPISQIDDKINQGMERICRFLNIERGILLQINEKNRKVFVSHSWAKKGVEPVSEDISEKEFPWIFNQIFHGKSYSFVRVEDLPDEAGKDKQSVREIGTISSFSIPLISGGNNFGALAFGSVYSEKYWSEELIQSLKLVGETFANALLRKRAEESLKTAFTEIRQLKEKIEAERNYLIEEIKLAHNFEDIIGESQPLKSALIKVEQVAPTDTTVLIMGESGTGKELIARAVHNAGTRKDRPLIKVNCATLPSNLIESELFGHVKGAYSGAHISREGRFELANGATLFLDEIGELPLDLQSKLLRVLQDGEFERLGSSRTLKVDVRIIAATNRNLEEEVQNKRFRKDLYYRLNVFPIHVPSLRERKEDIPLLINWFVKKFAEKMRKPIRIIPKHAIEELSTYDWPGNVRELENVIERSVINTKDAVFHLADKIYSEKNPDRPIEKRKYLVEIEREYISDTLRETGGKVSGSAGAAVILGLHPETLRSRMKKLGITTKLK